MRRGLGSLAGPLLGRALRFRLLPRGLLALCVHPASLLLSGLLPGGILRRALLLHLLLASLFGSLLFRGILGGPLLLHLLLAGTLGGLLPGGVLGGVLCFHLLLSALCGGLLYWALA